MLKTTYAHLNTIQKGSFAEAYAKMAFTLEGFEVYTTEFDDRGVDFVVRSPGGGFFSVQVKSTGETAQPCIYAGKFSLTPDFLFCAVRLIEGEEPELFLARGSDWMQSEGCLNFNRRGGRAGSYYEIRFSKRHTKSLEQHRFANYVSQLRTAAEPSIKSGRFPAVPPTAKASSRLIRSEAGRN
ncbi:MAG: DUF4365 domain-containing protein [Puniceicoccaceae bacterium]|nr:MAG: DUF4365 domain-containing protein [Puniceicoccaceae bacterium]